jgi:hypothetical protein
LAIRLINYFFLSTSQYSGTAEPDISANDYTGSYVGDPGLRYLGFFVDACSYPADPRSSAWMIAWIIQFRITGPLLLKIRRLPMQPDSRGRLGSVLLENKQLTLNALPTAHPALMASLTVQGVLTIFEALLKHTKFNVILIRLRTLFFLIVETKANASAVEQ